MSTAAFSASVDPGLSGQGFTNKKITVKLDDSNYLIWKQQVYFMAKQHRLFSYLNGSVRVPPKLVCSDETSLEVDNPAFEMYEQLDYALASWLLASITSSVLPDLVGLKTSSQIWLKLNRLYSDKFNSKILYYKNLLTNQRKGEPNMCDYLANLKSACDHLALLGEPVSDTTTISHILNGLTMEYESVIAIINTTKQKFDLDIVTIMLLDSEARQKSFIANSLISTLRRCCVIQVL